VVTIQQILDYQVETGLKPVFSAPIVKKLKIHRVNTLCEDG